MLYTGGVTQDPSHSDNSFLSSGPSVSHREMERGMREIDLIKTMKNTAENAAMQMIETTYMEIEAKIERYTERILPIPTEIIEAPIEVITSPVNEEGDNEEQSFATECHGKKWSHTTEVLDAKVKKPQFR